MTERVDFYVLKSTAIKQRWMFACRLAEKAFLRDFRVVIANDTLADAQAIDDLLWTFNERSFVPHQIYQASGPTDAVTKVHLVVEPAAPASADLLVNLTAQVPTHWERHARIAEIIDADEERRRLGRERFKTYRDLQIELQTHQLGETDHG